VGKHLTRHGADAILPIIVVMHTFQKTMEPNEVKRAKSKVERGIFLFKSLLVLFVLLVVDSSKGQENNDQDNVENGQIKLILAKMASSVKDF